MNSLTEARISEVRAFNRFYTKVIGVLQSGMHDSPYSLTEGRVLYEVAHADRLETGELRGLLDLDAGYLSRILARLDGDGLIIKERSATDARKQLVRLSAAGAEAFATLDRRSSEEVQRLLDRLPEDGQERLVTGMRTIRSLLDAPAERPRTLIRPPRAGDLSWVVQRHGALYAEEYGWGMDFERTVARIVADFDQAHDACWIAEAGTARAGSVFCVRRDDTTAQLRLLLVEPSARGLGIGAALVRECERHARRCGYTSITLWTNSVLLAARGIYRSQGYQLVKSEPHTSFGQKLIGETWTLALK